METTNVMPMEQLPINNNGGQGYGFTLYQTELDNLPKEIVIHNVRDRAQVCNKARVRFSKECCVERGKTLFHVVKYESLATVK